MKHFKFLDIYEDWTSDPRCGFTGKLKCCNSVVVVVVQAVPAPRSLAVTGVFSSQLSALERIPMWWLTLSSYHSKYHLHEIHCKETEGQGLSKTSTFLLNHDAFIFSFLSIYGQLGNIEATIVGFLGTGVKSLIYSSQYFSQGRPSREAELRKKKSLTYFNTEFKLDIYQKRPSGIISKSLSSVL